MLWFGWVDFLTHKINQTRIEIKLTQLKNQPNPKDECIKVMRIWAEEFETLETLYARFKC